ncbi:MAG: glycoside hydrolase family 127 protein [Eubacteriales bacterium]|nr:glycoside hydrolase family 127 protein [Eubacteriales bacterium]
MATKNLTYDKIDITGGFWQEKQTLIRETTIWNVYKRFSDTGRFEAFKLDWKEGMPNKPHYFWDSDVAKWLESVAYLTKKKREPELEKIVDDIVDDIERGRLENGYFNIYFELFEPENIFKKRGCHELYCAGHLIEAAIAYDEATGKRKFLGLMEDYARLIKKVFMDEQSAAFDSPGHEEIELALVKLYDYTKNRDWLDLALFFINSRGSQAKLPEGDSYHRGTHIQDHLPVREQFTAEGHAVRACYLYCAMADLALRENDEGLRNACDKLFRNITGRKMYITGGIGSTSNCEEFEEDFRLPNDTAYCETCAALALALFARRLEKIDADARYADTVERIIYNGFLSGLSLDGKSFFYENAQEIDLEKRKIVRGALHENRNTHFPITQRVEVFGCSCCPPNVTRFISSIGDFVYNYDDETVYVNQYMDSTADIDGLKIVQKTNYPYDGRVALTITGGNRRMALRIPSWCRMWTLTLNGKVVTAEPVKGYVFVDMADGDETLLDMRLDVKVVHADPRVAADRGMRAVTYGPFVMCIEGVDNGGSLTDVKLVGNTGTVGFDESLGLPCVYFPAVRGETDGLYSDTTRSTRFTAKMIPYFAFANRGECDMRIWVGEE